MRLGERCLRKACAKCSTWRSGQLRFSGPEARIHAGQRIVRRVPGGTSEPKCLASSFPDSHRRAGQGAENLRGNCPESWLEPQESALRQGRFAAVIVSFQHSTFSRPPHKAFPTLSVSLSSDVPMQVLIYTVAGRMLHA